MLTSRVEFNVSLQMNLRPSLSRPRLFTPPSSAPSPLKQHQILTEQRQLLDQTQLVLLPPDHPLKIGDRGPICQLALVLRHHPDLPEDVLDARQDVGLLLSAGQSESRLSSYYVLEQRLSRSIDRSDR